MRMPQWLRCGEFVYRDFYPGALDRRCKRRRLHRGAHQDPLGDVWQGKRR